MMKVAPLPPFMIDPLVQMALTEDLGRGGDITGNTTVPADCTATVTMTARDAGCIAGLDIAAAVFYALDPALSIQREKSEGENIGKGDVVLTISGNARAILAAERVALNFVGRLSGIATLTQKMVAAVGNHKAKIAATRKTTPGLRYIEKYAVMLGGGVPHRYALDDAILIKDNHIAMAGGVIPALQRAKAQAGHTVKIEVEVDTLAQLKEVLHEGVDIVMLDNMSLEDMTRAVRLVDGRALVEASGGVTLDRIPDIAATGVDLISSGAITHSVPNFDVGLDYKTAA